MRRQGLLFLVAIVLPCLLLVALSLRMLAQERELAEKRVADARRQLAAQTEQDLLRRLERITFDALSIRAVGAGAPAATRDHDGAVALVADIENETILLPWDRRSPRQPVDTNARFDAAVQRGEREELVDRRFDLASDSYGAALTQARTPIQTASAQLLLARALSKASRGQEALALYRRMLALQIDLVDDQDVPFALYSARRLLDLTDGTPSDVSAIVQVLQRAAAADALSPPGVYMARDVAIRVGDKAGESFAGSIQRAIDARARDIEQARALQKALPSLLGPIGFTAESARRDRLVQAQSGDEAVSADRTASVWQPFGPEQSTGSPAALWLVSVTRLPAPANPLLIAVRATSVFADLPVSIVTSGDGEPLSRSFPGLRAAMTVDQVSALAGEPVAQRRFYLVALLLVLGVTLSGGYLFWRDVQRDVRLAQMRSQFVSSVSHELKTPLTAIRMFAETLQLGRPVGQAREEYLQTIVNESERLTRLLNNVLDFSKIEQGRKTYHRQPCSLPAVVRSAAQAMTYPLSQQGFELRLAIAQDLPRVAADADAIEQAILNLLSNAMKYSGQGREIGLRLDRQNGDAVISVTDMGLGIPSDEHARIFEKFYRVAGRERQLIPGTGLGLTLVAHVVEAHGGRVTVRSAPGDGSTFSIVLPLCQSEPIECDPATVQVDDGVATEKSGRGPSWDPASTGLAGVASAGCPSWDPASAGLAGAAPEAAHTADAVQALRSSQRPDNKPAI